MHHPHGRHVLAELRGVHPELLDDPEALGHALRTALIGAGADVRQLVAERFTPQGATVVALLAESHATVHTWPERGTALVDVFTCGDTADPELGARRLALALGATGFSTQTIHRGGVAVEPISPGVTRHWALDAVRVRVDTDLQEVVIADTAQGVALFCDDERQSAEHSQLTYHEALFVPAALLAERRERVLVIGSSEGVVSELAVACGATTVDHVDLDEQCVRLCAEHLPYGYTVDDLERDDLERQGPVRIHYADGLAFVAETAESWDVIVVDLPDERPDDPSAQLNRLYTEDFLADCAARLRPGGVVVAQAGSPAVWRDETLRAAWARFGAVFAQTVYLGCPEHEWAFLCGLASPVSDPGELAAARLPGLGYTPRTLDADDLRARTVAPSSLRRSATPQR